MKAIYLLKPGDAQAMAYTDLPDPEPKAGEVLVELKAIGVNYIDVYYRTGLYKTDLPFVLGLEGAGEIIGLGKGVRDFNIGDRVAYVGVLGAYAQKHAVPAEKVVRLPAKISFKEGASLMVQGITSHYLSHSTYPLKKGEMCLIHAAAGGVGLLLCQAAKMIGATVIATVSTEEKANLVRKTGADHVIIYTKNDFVAEIKKITGGKGVNVVYDSVGVDTFERGLDCLMPRGMMVLFGQSSGVVPAFNLGLLAQKGSLYVTRPGINAYISSREELTWRASEVFDWVSAGKMKLSINHEFPLSKASQAHEALEGRRTTGKILLLP